MKIICIKRFRDKTTAKRIEDQTLIYVGDVLDCDDELAKERIKKGFAKEYIEDLTENEVENEENTEDLTENEVENEENTEDSTGNEVENEEKSSKNTRKTNKK